ncbi:MAG: MCP four helix bundle domain-containing protein, partial [Clostridiales bacterium]|nr:MCP four helix bundle domain-containing protein [Clostridiales bacterium]
MWFSNLKIRIKLLTGFGVVIALSIALSIFGYIQLDNIDDVYTVLIDRSAKANLAITEAARYFAMYRRDMVSSIASAGDTAAIDELKINYDKNKLAMEEHFNDYFEAVEYDTNLGPDETKERQDRGNAVLNKIETEYEEAASSVFEQAYANNVKAAKAGLDVGLGIAAEIDEEIDALKLMAEELTDAVNISNSEQADLSKNMLLGIVAAAVLIAVSLALYIANLITKSVEGVSRAATSISKGNFDVEVGSEGKDETAILSNSLLELKMVVQHMANDINKLNGDFIEGEIGSRIETSVYEGEFLNIIGGINKTIDELSDDLLYSVEVVSAVAEGNFNIEIKEMPGQKAIMTQSFRTVMANLGQFNKDIVSIIDGAANGTLGLRVDISNYKGGWQEMAAGLNRLLVAIVEPVREAIGVLEDL